MSYGNLSKGTENDKPYMNANVNELRMKKMSFGDNGVVQDVDPTTTVILDVSCGRIRTGTLSTAAGASTVFQLNNTNIVDGSRVFVSVVGYTGLYGTNGLPYLTVDNATGSSCLIYINNIHPTNALTGNLDIDFIVTNP